MTSYHHHSRQTVMQLGIARFKSDFQPLKIGRQHINPQSPQRLHTPSAFASPVIVIEFCKTCR
ncbi:hypothetical protein SESBI_34757 [Sesbania bispinosa]|nr:hypothetical protein SESBI_34757 [Sesbania bispinosa]